MNISYFSIESGETPNIFFGSLIDAADRGVTVNLLLDGMFHGLKREHKSIIYIISRHPNMNLRFYEVPNLLLPWTFNNRMHDKYIIADDRYAIIGGRNIGDKYFAPEWYDSKVSNDRDVILINTRPEEKTSVIYEMKDYFNSVWNSKYTKPIIKNTSDSRYKKYAQVNEDLKRKSNLARELNKNIFENTIDLEAISFPTNKVSFINNPIERFSKEPWVWYEITQLMKSAKKSIFIQSPYIIPTKRMMGGFIGEGDFKDIKITALTNSMGSSPNLPAFSGYMNYRKEMVDNGIELYEYQSIDSLHTKAFIIDNNIFALGSFNTDPRSTYLSTESMVIIHSKEAAQKLEEGLLNYLGESLLVAKDYYYVEKEGIEVVPVRPIKKVTLKIMSYIIRLFEHLL